VAAKRVLRVVVGERCSLCDVVLDRVRTPVSLLGLRLAVESLDVHDHRQRYAARVPVLLDGTGRVLDEGRISAAAAWKAAMRARLGRLPRRDSGT
jgi:hypothetical protein